MKSVFSILCSLLFIFCCAGQTQHDTLIGVVDQELIKINKNTGNIDNFVAVTGVPPGANTYKLTWCEPNQCFYSLSQAYPPTLAKIDLSGNYTILGALSFSTGTLYMCEAVAFNRFDGELYVSGSLNGNPNSVPADYYSETLLRVDTTTLLTTVIGSFTTPTSTPADADALAFGDNGMVHFYDGQPGQFDRFYRQDISFANPSVLLYSSGYNASRNLTVKGDDLFFSQNRALKKINIPTLLFSNVGTMFTAADFNGQYMTGLTWRVDCPNQDLFGSDTTICTGQSLTLSPSVTGTAYLWQDGSTNSTFTAVNAGNYWVEVTNNGCTYPDTIAVSTTNSPSFSFGNDTTLCFGESLLLDQSSTAGSFVWQDGSTGSSFTISSSGIYWLSITNSCGTSSDSITVDYHPDFFFDLGNDTTICSGNTIELNCNVPGSTVVWQDGSTATTFTASNTGEYYAEALLNGCQSSDTIQITTVVSPQVDLGNDMIICEGSDAVITVQNQNGSVQWNTGSTESSIVVSSAGLYVVEVINQCGTATDTITVEIEDCYCGFYVPNAFTPNDDEFNSRFGPVFDCTISQYRLEIFNRWGEVIFESEDPNYMWDATYLGKKVQDGTYAYKINYSTEYLIVETIVGHVSVIR